MGRAKRMKERRQRGEPSESILPVVWNVGGWDQHGDEINFDVPTREEAEKHVARYNRLGGISYFKRLVWNGPAAAYREPR